MAQDHPTLQVLLAAWRWSCPKPSAEERQEAIALAIEKKERLFMDDLRGRRTTELYRVGDHDFVGNRVGAADV